MTSTQGVTCTVCDKQRAPGQIHQRESRVLKGAQMYICNTCEAARKEPRAFIIIVARTGEKGLDRMKEYIIHRRYEGPTITGKEILK